MTEMAYGWAPITKIEDQPDGTVIVHGPMSSTALDRDRQRFSQAFLDQAIPQWFGESGNIREQHDPKRAVGNALQVKRDDVTGVWDLAAHVVDSEAVKKVRNKVLKGFSIGVKQPHVTYGKTDSPGGEIDGGIICETSVVDRPSNPETIFQVVKSDGLGDELQFELGDGLIEKSWDEGLHPRGPGGKFHKGETVVSEHGGKTIMGLHAGSSPSNQGRVTVTQIGEGGSVQHHSVPRSSIRAPHPHELEQARQHTGGNPGPAKREVTNPHHVGKQVRLNTGKTGKVVEADPHANGMSRVQFDDDGQTRYVPNKLMKADELIEKAITHAPPGSPTGGQFLPGGVAEGGGQGLEANRKGAKRVAVTGGGGGGKGGGGGAKKVAKKAAAPKPTPAQRAAAAQAKRDQAAAVRAAAAKVRAAQAATKAQQQAAAKAAKAAAKPAPRVPVAAGKPHQPSNTPGPLDRPAATTPTLNQPTQKADEMTVIEKSAWSEAAHPRGPGGKFVSVGSLNPKEHHAGGEGMPVIGKTAAGKEVAGSLGHTEKYGWHVAQYQKGNEWMPVHEVRRYDPATDGPKWGAKAKVGDKVVGKSLADRVGTHTVLEHGVGSYGPTMKVRNDVTGEEYTSHAGNFKKVKPVKANKADEPDSLVGEAFAEIARAGLSDEARMALEFLVSKADEGEGDEGDEGDDEVSDDPRVGALIEQAEAMQAMLEAQADEIDALSEKLDQITSEAEVTKVDEPGLIKAAVAEVGAAYEGRLATIEAELTKALAMPELGGPVQMRTSTQAALSQAREQADVRAQIDELTTKADQFRTTDRELADGYDERARRLIRTLHG